ncbi:MAG: sigma-54-dependent transcriptional regulator [Desulfosoma sp.]|uniref:sigma-54-dependent transcriptional regulator n=1 Tax=Desulfosoma sp. TaxID=2603217 RepID=UPI00404987BE
MTGRFKILVVDDELIVRESLVGWLKKGGYMVGAVSGGREALESLERAGYDLVFLDIKMPDMNGIDVLKEIKQRYPGTMVVMITAYGSVESAVEAMKLGANDYLMKPFEPDQLSLLVEKLLQHKKLIDENILLREQIATAAVERYQDMIGVSPAMQALFEMVERVAAVDSPVLIKGETGTGKELVAKAIHARSPRRYGPFIAINCGAFTESLLESELFGHEVGSFTGAVKAKKGRLELVRGGTLFLDEVGEIPMKMQVDLLRVLEEHKMHRVGGTRDITVDFRLISATHRDLSKAMEEGYFRRDFYFRLNVVELEVPPLRARREDIPLLADFFLRRFRKETNKPVEGLDKKAVELLCAYDWPGNVRELENAVERAVVLAQGRILTEDDFAFLRKTYGAVEPQSLEDMERLHIQRILKQCRGNISQTARVLKINRTTLHHKIKKYGLQGSS